MSLNNWGGVLSLEQLDEMEIGATRRAEMIACGGLFRVRRGWFRYPDANADVLHAVELGGAVSCVSALHLLGVWTAPEWRRTEGRLHMRGSARARRAHPNTFCRGFGKPTPPTQSIDGVAAALECALCCFSDEIGVVFIDSVIHRKLMTKKQVENLLATAPRRIRRLLERHDKAESGTETMVRLRLRARGVRMAPQVKIPGLGRVDFLVGKRLIIEVDSRAFHDTEDSFERDRERDLKAAALGYITIRVTYKQVMHGWAAKEKEILKVIRRREHLRRLPAGTPEADVPKKRAARR